MLLHKNVLVLRTFFTIEVVLERYKECRDVLPNTTDNLIPITVPVLATLITKETLCRYIYNLQ